MTTERLMPMLCIVTGNPCRTDTVPIGAECPAPGGVCVPMTDLEYRLWQERGLAHAQLLAIASVLGGDDKGETRDHARWTPALDAARNLIAERDALREALRELTKWTEKSIDTRICPVSLLRALNRARALLGEAT